MSQHVEFSSFRVGQAAWFERSFTRDDFTEFSRLSGDENLLHHDDAHAETSEFGRPIVPLHLAASPLSAIAGMIFPGLPSLYLGHALRAPSPLFYGETVVYSARIAQIEPTRRVLGLSVLGVVGDRVVIEATVDVAARAASWTAAPGRLAYESAEPDAARLLVTGASGAIGGAIALRAARQGRSLLLHARRHSAAAEQLARECRQAGSPDVAISAGELDHPSGRAALVEAMRALDDVALIAHTASPPIDAPPETLMAVNHRALHEAAAAALPRMLRLQHGVVLAIGSTAVEHHPAGWEDYVAAKTAMSGYVAGWRRRYQRLGIHGVVLAPSYVATSFSERRLPLEADTLLPEEVAERAVELLLTPPGADYVSLRPGDAHTGGFGFQAATEPTVTSPELGPQHGEKGPSSHDDTERSERQAPAPGEHGAISRRLEGVFRRVLRLSEECDLRGASVGTAWDSLQHIQLMMEVERELGLRIHSREIERTRSFEGLVALCQHKLTASSA